MARLKRGNGTSAPAGRAASMTAGSSRWRGVAWWLAPALPALILGFLSAGQAAAQTANTLTLGSTTRMIDGNEYRAYLALSTTVTVAEITDHQLGFVNDLGTSADVGSIAHETFRYGFTEYTITSFRLGRSNAAGANTDYESVSVSFSPGLPETAFEVTVTRLATDTEKVFSVTTSTGLDTSTRLAHNFGDGDGLHAAEDERFALKVRMVVNPPSRGVDPQLIRRPSIEARTNEHRGYDRGRDLPATVYARGEEICVQLEYSSEVSLSGSGTPFVLLDVGGTLRRAYILRGGPIDGPCGASALPDQTLKFSYVVQDGDVDTNGVRLCQRTRTGCTGGIELNGGKLTDVRGLPIYPFYYTSSAVQSHSVDARAPVPTNAFVDRRNPASIVLDFDERLRTDDHLPGKEAFRVWLGRKRVTVTRYELFDNGDKVRLHLPREVRSERVFFSYTAQRETLTTRPRLLGRSLQDRHWNFVESFETEVSNHILPTHLTSLDLKTVALRPTFSPDVTEYRAVVHHTFPATATLVESRPLGRATVTMTPSADADSARPGHQFAIGRGETVLTVTVTDRDGIGSTEYTIRVQRLPRFTLALDNSSISEDGGVASVTGTAASAMPVEFNLRIVPYRQAWTGVTEDDYTQSSPVMHFAAGATESTAPVTITAVNNDYDNPDRVLVVTGHSSELGGDFPGNPYMGGKHPLVIQDDDDPQPSSFALHASAGDDGTVTLQWSGDANGWTSFKYRWREYYELVAGYEHEHDRWSAVHEVQGSGTQSTTIREGLCVGRATTFEVWPSGRTGRRERVYVTPRLATPPVVRIAAETTGNVEHSSSFGDVTVRGSPTFGFVRSGDVTQGLCQVMVRFEELGKTQPISFPPGSSTSEYYTVALDREELTDPLCSVTWEVLDGEHYDVQSPEHRATVQVQGPGTTCAALYSGTMTVGVSGVARGFSGVSRNTFGGLTPRQVTFTGGTSRIERLAYGNNALQVLLSAQATQPFGVKLGTTRVTGFTYQQMGTHYQYAVPMADPEWSAGDSVAVEFFPVTGVMPAASSVQSEGLFAQHAEAEAPLTVSLEGPAALHDGANPFTLRLAFSEAVATTAEAMRDHVFAVSGGEVTAAAPVDGRRDLWEISIRPASDAEVLVLLPATESCNAAGAVCTADGNRLQTALAISVGRAPLTVAAEQVPAGHNGKTAITLRLAFSEAIGTGAATLRDHSLSASGGTVSEAKRVDGRSDLWQVTITPSGDEAVELALAPADASCSEQGAVCTRDGNPLREGVRVRVPRAPLTARFEQVPETHDGETPFVLRVEFSEDVATSYRTLRDTAFTVRGGR